VRIGIVVGHANDHSFRSSSSGVAERIQLVEDLWEGIAAEAAVHPERLPVSDAQRRELLRRSEAPRRNPHQAVPLDEALNEIERSLG
jgi:putative addiction module component (TIGR02574 family)